METTAAQPIIQALSTTREILQQLFSELEHRTQAIIFSFVISNV